MKASFDTNKIKWGICILLPLLCLLIPSSDVFTPTLKTFLVITIFCISLAATEVINLFITSLLFMTLYAFSGIVTTSQAFGAFGAELIWISVSTLLTVNVVSRTTILNRMAYWAVIQSKGSYLMLLMALCSLAIVSRILLQAAMGIICIVTIAAGIVEALNMKKTKAGAAMILVPAFAYLAAMFFIYPPDTILLFYGQASSLIKLSTTYGKYFQHNAIFVFVPFLCTLGIYFITKPKNTIDIGTIKELQSALPAMTSTEKKVLTLLLLFVLYLFTSQFHGMNIFYGFVFLPILFFMPGINAGTIQDVQKINFSMVLFLAACLAIGIVGGAAGIDKAVTKVAVPLLEGMPETIFLGFLYGLIFAFNFVMTPIAEYAALTLPVTQICLDLGFNLDVAYYIMLIAGQLPLLPYELVPLLVAVTIGEVATKDFFKIMGLVTIIVTVFTFTLGIAYWTMVGLL